MRTNKEVQFIHDPITGQFQFYTGQEFKSPKHLVTIPKGTPVTNKTAIGEDKNYHFIDNTSFLPLINGVKQYGLIHDLKYHGANVPKEFID